MTHLAREVQGLFNESHTRYAAIMVTLHLPRHEVAQPAATQPPLLLAIRLHSTTRPAQLLNQFKCRKRSFAV